MERWKDRVALVTGASVGIGAAVARALVQHGMKVVGCARSVDKIEVWVWGAKKKKGGRRGGGRRGKKGCDARLLEGGRDMEGGLRKARGQKQARESGRKAEKNGAGEGKTREK